MEGCNVHKAKFDPDCGACKVKQSKELEQMHDDFRAVFLGSSTKAQGKRVLFDMLDFCGTMAETTTGYEGGRRSVGLHILDAIDVDRMKALMRLEEENIGMTAIRIDQDELKDR